jgi:hypothetical protein
MASGGRAVYPGTVCILTLTCRDRGKHFMISCKGYVNSCGDSSGVDSVSNGSGPSLRVRVRVGTEPESDWRFGSSINPNCQFGYDSIDFSLPV